MLRLFRHYQKMCIFVLGMGCYIIFKSYLLMSGIQSEKLPSEMDDFVLIRPTTGPARTTTTNTTVDHKPMCGEHLLGLPAGVNASKCGGNCLGMTCKALLFGNVSSKSDSEIYEATLRYMKLHPPVPLKENDYIRMAKNCTDFKLTRGYNLEPLSQSEKEFPLAYNLLVHRDIEQIERLLRAIYHPQNSYCIHLDGNAPSEMLQAVRDIADCFDNVFMASKIEKIVYAGITRLQADLNCMKDHLESQIKWKYILNVAGQSFPLKTNFELVEILKLYNGANDIEGIYGRRVLKGRFTNKWIELGTKMNKTEIKNPPPPHDMDIVRGSAYGVFSRAFVDYVLHDSVARDLLDWSRNTYSPDEHFWATLHHTYSNPHLKPPGGYSGDPNHKEWLAVHVKWGGVDKCRGVWKRGVCVLGVRDLPSLLDQRALFCNKFYQDFQPLAYTCLEAWLKQRTLCQEPIDADFYSSLKFIPRAKSKAAWFNT